MNKVTAQNEVSLFMAGYAAGLADHTNVQKIYNKPVSGSLAKENINNLFYSELEFGNRVREMLRAYQSQDTHEGGMEELYKLIK